MRKALSVCCVAVLALSLAAAAYADEVTTAEPKACPAAEPASSLESAIDPLESATQLAGACILGGSTNVQWGMGSSCNAALTNLRNHIVSDAPSVCDPDPVCSIGPTQIVTECFFYQGQYRVDGYANVKCQIIF